jgi:hypothetical protein
MQMRIAECGMRIGQWSVVSWILAAALGALAFPAVLTAEEVTIKFTGLARGQAYEFTLNADGTASLRPIVTVAVGGVPAPVPTPTPAPNPNPTLSAQVLALTRSALLEGGSSSTAASLAAVYSVVGNQVNTDKLPLANVGPALKELSDAVVPAREAAIWNKWRGGVAMAMAGKLDSKASAVSTLDSVTQGTRDAVDGLAQATGSPAIDWQKLFDMLLPLLLKLLEKFLL